MGSSYSSAPPAAVTKASIDALGVDADSLDGIDSTGFLLAGAKAADADKLDGVDGADYARQTLQGGIYGLNATGGSTTGYMRSPSSGFLPDQATSSLSVVGTTSWPFKSMAAVDFYEGGTLLNAKYAQIANIPSEIAAVSCGAVGSYAFLIPTATADTDYAHGATAAGSVLEYVGIDGGNIEENVSPAGTWRCMGYSQNNDDTDPQFDIRTATLWLRIS